MFARSVYNTTKISSGEVLVLSQRPYKPSDPVWRVLVAVPQTYEDLVVVSRHIFSIDEEDEVVFSTEDLDICEGNEVSIHSSSWEFVRLAVRTVMVDSQPPFGSDLAGYLADDESDALSSSIVGDSISESGVDVDKPISSSGAVDHSATSMAPPQDLAADSEMVEEQASAASGRVLPRSCTPEVGMGAPDAKPAEEITALVWNAPLPGTLAMPATQAQALIDAQASLVPTRPSRPTIQRRRITRILEVPSTVSKEVQDAVDARTDKNE